MDHRALILAAALVFDPITSVCASENVIVARTQPVVSLIFRANDAVVDLKRDGLSDTLVLRQLLARALRGMYESIPTTSKASEPITMRILYFSDGGFDATYRIETVAGIRRIADLHCTVGELRRMSATWARALGRGEATPGLTVRLESREDNTQ